VSESQITSVERLVLALSAINDGIWDWDVASGVVYFSPRWKEMLGYADTDIANNFTGWQSLIHPDDLGKWLETWTNFMDETKGKFSVEYRLRNKDGSWHWLLCQGVGERLENGHIRRIAGCHTDIAKSKQYELHLRDYQIELESTIRKRTQELEEANAELRRTASRDYLTGVWNRRSFDEHMVCEWSRARRNVGTLSVIMVDIDHFKKINDTFGHLVGDACLTLVAQSLKKLLIRPTDDIYRYGGEEFVILLPGTKLDGAIEVAERMRTHIEQLKPPEGMSGNMSISLGVATGHPDYAAEDWKVLIAIADSAMYFSKNNGRNQVTAREWPTSVGDVDVQMESKV
jgi:diguanylate cyclase (GGDEF)-like protein/PAS domain S-box-containing protein